MSNATATVRKFIPAGTPILCRPLNGVKTVRHVTVSALPVPSNAAKTTNPQLCAIDGTTNFIEFASKGFLVIVHTGKVQEEQDTPDVFDLTDDAGDEDTVIDTVPGEKGDTRCVRCGGAGILRQFRHVQGGTCFKCGGTGSAR